MLFNYRYKDNEKWQYKFKGKSLHDNKGLATDLHNNGYEIERGIQDFIGERLITKWEPWKPFDRIQCGGHQGISYADCVKIFEARYGNEDKTLMAALDVFNKIDADVSLRTVENVINIVNSEAVNKIYYQAFLEWKDDNPDIDTDSFVYSRKRKRRNND